MSIFNGIPSLASQTKSGLMSKSDKTKLDGIAAGANNYTLPAASSITRGGVKTGYTANGKNYPVQLSNDEKMYVNVPWDNTIYGTFTGSSTGLVPAANSVNNKTTKYLAADGSWQDITSAETSVDIGKIIFSSNTWSEVITHCQKIKANPTSIKNYGWKVGDSMKMLIGGVSYDVVIIGINQDTYYGSTATAPYTFQLLNCLKTQYAMNTSNTNNGGWASCNMRTMLRSGGTIFKLFPAEVQNGIKAVGKLTSAGNGNTTVPTTKTSETMFLLSENEIFGKKTYSTGGEGLQYQYYASGNSTIKKLGDDGSASYWWERSPYASNTTFFCRVIISGNADYNFASATYGVSPAFCF